MLVYFIVYKGFVVLSAQKQQESRRKENNSNSDFTFQALDVCLLVLSIVYVVIFVVAVFIKRDVVALFLLICLKKKKM